MLKNPTELEFNRLGFKLGDEIKVTLIGSIYEEAAFVITQDVIETKHFPIKDKNGEVIFCHLDHVNKNNITL